MIENGADIKAKGKDNSTPLHRATVFGHLNVVDYLINYKADINSMDRYIVVF